MIAWVATYWPAVALSAWVLLAVHFCWGFRENMNRPAWLFLGVFIASFFSSNSAAFIPPPDPVTLENARIWVADVQYIQEQTYKACVLAALTIAFLTAVRGRFKGSTLLLFATVLAALGGEFIESAYCRWNDPVRYVSHVYLFEGGRNPTCARMAEFGIAPYMSWLGFWFVPMITVLPSIYIMGRTAWRKRAGS